MSFGYNFAKGTLNAIGYGSMSWKKHFENASDMIVKLGWSTNEQDNQQDNVLSPPAEAENVHNCTSFWDTFGCMSPQSTPIGPRARSTGFGQSCFAH